MPLSPYRCFSSLSFCRLSALITIKEVYAHAAAIQKIIRSASIDLGRSYLCCKNASWSKLTVATCSHNMFRRTFFLMSLGWLVVSNAGNGIGWLVDSVALARWSMGHGVWRWLSGWFCYRVCYRFVIVLCHVNSPHLWDTLTLGHDTLIYIYVCIHTCMYICIYNT